jgi:hypothetical protein
VTPNEAYGLVILSSLFTAIYVWVTCWRYWKPTLLPQHDGYVRGWNACSRVRDRQESEERKTLLLNTCTTAQSRVATETKTSSGYDTLLITTAGEMPNMYVVK